MGTTDPRTSVLRTGEAVLVRGGEPADGPDVAAFFVDVDATTDFLVSQAGERDVDPASRSRWLAAQRDAPGAVVLLAFVEGLLVGELDARAQPRARLRHVAQLGMSVRSGWRGRGVGTALLTALLDWARAHETIEKVALAVMARNERAISLYRTMGFQPEGRLVREYRLGPDRYEDGVPMRLFVKPSGGVRPPTSEGLGETPTGRASPL